MLFNLRLSKFLQLGDLQRVAAMAAKGLHPGIELFSGQAIAAKRLLSRQEPVLHGIDDGGLAAGDPAGLRRRQVGQRQDAAIGQGRGARSGGFSQKHRQVPVILALLWRKLLKSR